MRGQDNPRNGAVGGSLQTALTRMVPSTKRQPKERVERVVERTIGESAGESAAVIAGGSVEDQRGAIVAGATFGNAKRAVVRYAGDHRRGRSGSTTLGAAERGLGALPLLRGSGQPPGSALPVDLGRILLARRLQPQKSTSQCVPFRVVMAHEASP
jgi:hypothetical protein